MDATALSPHARSAQWQALLFRFNNSIANLRCGHAAMDKYRHHSVQQHSYVRHFGAPAAQPRQQLRSTRDDHGGGNPSTATTELIDLSASNPAWVLAPICRS